MPLECTKIDDPDAPALPERTPQQEDPARTRMLRFAEPQHDAAARWLALLATDRTAAARRMHDLKNTHGSGATRHYQDAVCLNERLRPHRCDADNAGQHDD
jgi:hypothetical protein